MRGFIDTPIRTTLSALLCLTLACAGCSGVSDNSGAPATTSQSSVDPPEVTAGERLFLETRFAQFFKTYLDAGVTYIVIGTAAVKNPGFLSDAAYAFPGHIVAGLDARDGKVAVEGWSKLTGHDVIDLAKKFEDYGVEALIYTDIGRDGMMNGVNIEATLKLAAAVRIPVIASGGLNSLEDVQAVCTKLGPEGVIGAIAGRALYEGELDLKQAQAAADKAAGKA